MSRTLLTAYALASASAPGTTLADPTPVAADAVNGNSVPNSGLTAIRVKNTDTASHTLTLITPASVDGLTVADDSRVIPASSSAWIARLPIAAYGANINFTVDSADLQVVVFEP